MGQNDTKPKRHQILLLGNYNGDESKILDCLKKDEVQREFDSPYKAYGFQEENVSYKGVYVWYPPGLTARGRCSERIFLPLFFRYALAVVYLIDSRDSRKIQHAQFQLAEYREDENLKDALIVAIASKEENAQAEPKSPEQLEQIINEGYQASPIKVFPADVDTGEGINECFDWLIDKVAGQSGVARPWEELTRDVSLDGKAGFNIFKGAWKKVVSKFRQSGSKAT